MKSHPEGVDLNVILKRMPALEAPDDLDRQVDVRDMLLLEPENDRGGRTSRFSGEITMIASVVNTMSSSGWLPEGAVLPADRELTTVSLSRDSR
jgi:hypothetical protein